MKKEGSYSLMDRVFFGMMKRFWKWIVVTIQHCKGTYLILLNSTLKNGENVKFHFMYNLPQ